MNVIKPKSEAVGEATTFDIHTSEASEAIKLTLSQMEAIIKQMPIEQKLYLKELMNKLVQHGLNNAPIKQPKPYLYKST